MSESIDPTAVADFFELDHVALVGASADPKHFSHSVLVALRHHGVSVVPVNPNEASLDDDEVCYPSVAAIPGDLDGAIVMVNHERAVQIVKECIDRGVTHVWLFKGLGSESAVSEEAIALCHEHGIAVIPGACPLMFLRPVRGFHRFHRGIRRVRGGVAKAS